MTRPNRWLTTVWLVSVIGLGSLVGTVTAAHSYEPSTHGELSATAVDRSSLDVILKTQYRLDAGTGAVVGGKNTLLQSVRQWIADGGILEDSPPYRALNHFHNPTVPWLQAGVSIGRSSIYWQQEPSQGFLFGGTWSWPEARDRFYDFLTLNDPDARSEALAKAARALEQVMHMIQDATSPPHTREDPHLLHDGYEAHIDELRGGDKGSDIRARFDRLLALPAVLPSSEIFTATINEPRAPDPIARLIDTDRYTTASSRPARSPATASAPSIRAGIRTASLRAYRRPRAPAAPSTSSRARRLRVRCVDEGRILHQPG